MTLLKQQQPAAHSLLLSPRLKSLIEDFHVAAAEKLLDELQPAAAAAAAAMSSSGENGVTQVLGFCV